MEQVMRIELTTTAWEAVVLPLNYTCIFRYYTISERNMSSVFRTVKNDFPQSERFGSVFRLIRRIIVFLNALYV